MVYISGSLFTLQRFALLRQLRAQISLKYKPKVVIIYLIWVKFADLKMAKASAPSAAKLYSPYSDHTWRGRAL